MLRLITYIAALLTFSASFGQRSFGLAVVKELASEKYHGRGYVNDGHKLAANYVANTFKENDLQPIGDSYYQYFDINVNTFPSAVSVQFDSLKLKAGVDFIVNPNSGSAKGTFIPAKIDSDKDLVKVLSKYRGKERNIIFIISDPNTNDIDSNERYKQLRLNAAFFAPVLWVTEKRLIWSIGDRELPFPIIMLNKELSPSPESFKTISIHIKNEYKEKLKTQNVIGKIEGRNKKKTIVISAHYDHLGRMGSDAYFPGANDNASGLAMLLYLIEHFSDHQPRYNLVFMAFGAEEKGITGSKHYVDHPLFPLKDIKFLINLDMLGTGDDGIAVVNGAVYKKQFKKLAKLNQKGDYLKKIQIRGKAKNSDHYYFSEAGVPSIFIYTKGGVKHYHDVNDKAKTLPLNKFEDLSKLLTKYINKL